MKLFSIKEVERLSGISAQTIRIWEYRYTALHPQRTSTNIRLYSIEDLQRLFHISLLVCSGCRISSLSSLSLADLAKKSQALDTDSVRMQMAIHQLIIYKYRSDVESLEATLDSCVHCWGIDVTIRKIIVPFLQVTELLSYNDKSCETHFAITAIRSKIIFGIETVETSQFDHRTALLFLQEGEHYDLVLLYIAYLLKHCGIRVLYLGTNVPCKYVKQIIIEKQPQRIYTYLTDPGKCKLQDLIEFVQENLPDTEMSIIIPGSPASSNCSLPLITIEELATSLTGAAGI